MSLECWDYFDHRKELLCFSSNFNHPKLIVLTIVMTSFFHDVISVTSSPWRHLRDVISVTSSPWRHLHDVVSVTSSPWRHLCDVISVTSSPWRHLRDVISVTSSPWRHFIIPLTSEFPPRPRSSPLCGLDVHSC